MLVFDAESIFAFKDKNLVFTPFYFNTQVNLLAIQFYPGKINAQ
jgi:hypothetical protein